MVYTRLRIRKCDKCEAGIAVICEPCIDLLIAQAYMDGFKDGEEAGEANADNK